MTARGFVIMIVDDDDSMRRAVRRLVKSHGFTVETFASAEDFLAADQLDQTACLVLDVQMPGLNGLELQGQLVASGRRIPIVFITAFNDEDARRRALKAGALCYLVKPFAESDLLNCIARALPSETDAHPPARLN